jgi:hypothetical protein
VENKKTLGRSMFSGVHCFRFKKLETTLTVGRIFGSQPSFEKYIAFPLDRILLLI